MGAKLLLEGKRFDRLLVLEDCGIRKRGRVHWFCICDCGKTKNISADDLTSGKTQSCGCLRNEKLIERNLEWSGEKSKNWKGGKFKFNGYWFIYSPNHPNANAQGRGYVKQSRLVMEKHLGRYLSRDEVVHHKNEIRDDDEIENLEVLDNSAHLSIHHKGKNQKRDNKTGRFLKGVV